MKYMFSKTLVLYFVFTTQFRVRSVQCLVLSFKFAVFNVYYLVKSVQCSISFPLQLQLQCSRQCGGDCG